MTAHMPKFVVVRFGPKKSKFGGTIDGISVHGNFATAEDASAYIDRWIREEPDCVFATYKLINTVQRSES